MTTATRTETRRRTKLEALLPALLLCWATAACAPAGEGEAGEAQAAESWQVTAWGELYEVFPEIGPLVAGGTATVHTHVTVLDGFAPLAEGRVSVVLTGAEGDQVFSAGEPVRPGVFEVELTPQDPGEHDLVFRVESAAGGEEIRGGRVRVGTPEAPGGVVVAPAPRGATAGGEPLAFLKEEQWQGDFATGWVKAEPFAGAVSGPATVRTPAGGEVWLTAPVEAVVQAQPWPWPGQTVPRGATVLRLASLVAREESLAHLRSEVAELEAELELARLRRERVERLAGPGLVSREEVDEATAEAAALEARVTGARQDLAAATAVRQGGGGGELLRLTAPFVAQVAEVSATPGATVEAGQPLARLVVTDPVWLELALSPEAAVELVAAGSAGVVLELGGGVHRSFEAAQIRFVSRGPEVDDDTGTVPVLLELSAAAGLPLGSRGEARVLLGSERQGIVVPASALVDDGGVPVVYLQLSGERFARQPVEVAARQGDRVLVEGLVPGQRLVTRGGAAIRRSGLLSTGGAAHGHVH